MTLILSHSQIEELLVEKGYKKLEGIGGSTGMQWQAWEKNNEYIVLPLQSHSHYAELVLDIQKQLEKRKNAKHNPEKICIGQCPCPHFRSN